MYTVKKSDLSNVVFAAGTNHPHNAETGACCTHRSNIDAIRYHSCRYLHSASMPLGSRTAGRSTRSTGASLVAKMHWKLGSCKQASAQNSLVESTTNRAAHAASVAHSSWSDTSSVSLFRERPTTHDTAASTC